MQCRPPHRKLLRTFRPSCNGQAPISLDNEAADAPTPKLGDRGPGGARILLLGRFRLEKGHRLALNAIDRVRATSPETTMFFAGTGPLESALRQEVARRQLEVPVLMLGHVDDVAGLLERVDIVIVPSSSAPFGLVAIEAMAAERLVIASRVGGLEEIVEHGASGVLVEPGDADALAAEIYHYLEHVDERERLPLGGYRRYRERFTSHAMAKSYMFLYDELLGTA